MTAPLARLLEDQPVAHHPGWCARDLHDCHLSAQEAREGEPVMLVGYQNTPPMVHVGLLDPMTPAAALRFARFLSAHKHPELAALITRMAAMAEGAS